MSNGKGLSVHPLTKKNRSTGPQRKEKGKTKEREKRKGTVAMVNIANHRLRDTSEKRLQVDTSKNTDLKAEGNLEEVGQSKMTMTGYLALSREFSSETVSMSRQSLDRATFKDKFPPLIMILTGRKNGRCPKGPPYDHSGMGSKKSLQDTKACKLFKKSKQKVTARMYTVQTTRANTTANGLAIHTKERMYTVDVDSGASSHMMGSKSVNHGETKTIQQSSTNPGYSVRQWRFGLRHTSDGLHQGTWRLSVADSPSAKALPDAISQLQRGM